MRLAALVIVIVAALAAAPSGASADPLRLGPGFLPHPTLTQRITVKVDGAELYAMGWRKCGAGGAQYTTHQPALTFELTDAMPLRVRLEDDAGNDARTGGVMVFPDGTYLCEDDHGQYNQASWPKGAYKLYLDGVSTELSAVVSFEDPTRSKRELADAIAHLPTVTLGVAGAPNPIWQSAPATVSVDAADAGPSCARRNERVMPIARLDVTRAAPWFVAAGKADLFVITGDQKCVHPRDAHALAAGSYTLWTLVPRDDAPAAYALEADDRSAALVFPDAEHREVGALDAPLVVAGKVRPAERWYSRDASCRGAARAPDLYLRADQPLQKVHLSLLWSHAPERLHIYGPIEHIKENSRPRCADGNARDGDLLDVMEGTYAVWIGGDDGATGADWHLLVTRDGLAIDPMTTLAPIPDELTLADRAVTNHYPYFHGAHLADWTALWTKAPDRLFLYTRAAVDKLPAGEPLLVQWSNDHDTAAWRYDGSSVRVDTRLVTADRPTRVALPTAPTVPAADSVTGAQELAGPDDAKAIAAYYAVDNKYTACLGSYLEKHDPTWGHDSDVYKIGPGGHVTNVSDEVGRAGDRACGRSRVDAAETSLLARLARTRAARWKAHLTAVRTRFGL